MNPDDLRMGTWIENIPYEQFHTKKGDPHYSQNNIVFFIGFPYDEGVRRNGGRPGARDGPAAVRKFITRMGTLENVEFDIRLPDMISFIDWGDVPFPLTLEQAHEQLHERVYHGLSMGGTLICVGGGNDQSYPNASGFLRTLPENGSEGIGVINIDAHLDVRPKKNGLVHSGTPFRQMLEDSRWNEHCRFVEFAAQGSQCSKQHVDFVHEKKGSIVWLSTLRNSQLSVAEQLIAILDSWAHLSKIFISFDIDSITSADCPGVSAPSTIGLTSQEALDICRMVGMNPKVQLFDISELNPTIEDYRTPRLVTNMIYYFLLGRALYLKNH